MTTRRIPTRARLPMLTLGVLLLAATVAFGAVAVYGERFDKRAAVKRMTEVSGGKACAKSFRDGAKAMGVELKRGRTLCAYSPPVTGDTGQPDHELRVVGRILRKQTPRRLRKYAYLSLEVRRGGGDSYQLKVTPKGRKFALLRSPKEGGFPVRGSDPAIGALGEKNNMRLRAFGNKVVAFVNGKRLATVADGNPDELKGRKLAFGVGQRRDAKAGPVALFDRLRVSVPNPRFR